MKTTNKSKMMIAFLTVAALALVSMAGVALAKNVDADPAPVDSYVNGMLTVSANTADTFGVWAEYGKTTTVTFKDDAKYSKTMYFGKYTPAAPANVAAGTPAVLESLEAYVIIEFKDMKGVTLTYGHNSDTVTITNDNLGATDIKVTKGTVVVLDTLSKFSGKIAGNTVIMTLENVAGLELTAGTTDIMSGNLTKKDSTVEGAKYTVKMENTAYFGNKLTVGNGVTFKVAEGAELKGDYENSKPYALGETTTVSTVGMTVGATNTTGINVVLGAIKVGVNDMFRTTAAADDGVAALNAVEPESYFSSESMLYLVFNEGGNHKFYAGSLSFVPSFDSNGVAKLTATLGDNTPMTAIGQNVLDVSGTDIVYNSANYTCEFAFISTAGAPSKVNGYSDGAIVTQNVTDGDIVVVILKQKSDGELFAYYGTATVNQSTFTLSAPATITTADVGPAAQRAVSKIVPGAAPAPNLATAFEVANGGKLVVDGKIDIKYALGNNAYFVNSGKIDVKGEIVYETNNAVAPLECASAAVGINAAHYNVAPAAGSSSTVNVHHYTTLTKAMAAAKNVDIYGEMVILDDTTLTGTPVGTAASKNAFTVKAYSVLVVGQVDNPATDGVVEETKAAIVTLPATSSITMGGSPDGGYVKVEKGQFKIAPNETAPRGYDKIEANVFMKTTGFDVYTDLVTALNISVSGDVVKVRSATATIDENAEVKEGVTLQAENATSTPVDITVNPGKVFTVSGTVKDIHSITVETDATNGNGQLILKSVKFKLTGDEPCIWLAGTLEFASSFDNTTTAAFADFKPVQIVFNGEESIVKVVGKVLFRGFELNDTSTATLVDVTGKADFQVPFDSNIVVNMNIAGGTVNKGEDANFNITKLTATGAAKITLDTDVTPFVILEKAVIGTKSDAFADNANLAEMKLILDGEGDANAYAIIYGKFASDKIVITSSELNVPAKTVFYLVSVNGNNQYLYQTVFAALAYDSEEMDNYAMDMPFPEIVGHNFLGWYTNVQFSGNPFDSAYCGQQPTFYGKFALKTYVLTFEYQEGVKWLLDGIVVEGQKTTTYGNHNVKVAAAAGFDISKVTLKKGGAAYIAGESFPVAGDIVFSASEAAEKPAKADSFGLIETLLIIITVMVVIMAIIIALKLMRS